MGVIIWAILLAASGPVEDLNAVFTQSQSPTPFTLGDPFGEEFSKTPLPFPGQASQKEHTTAKEQNNSESAGPYAIHIGQTNPKAPSLVQYIQDAPHGPAHYRAADFLYPFHFFW